MKKVLRIDNNGLFIEDVILQDNEIIPADCVEIVCTGQFYRPKWNGTIWVEGLTQTEIDAIINSVPVNAKLEAVAEIEAATTIEGLRIAMLKYVNA